MELGKMKLPTIQKTAASKKAKDSKDNFDVENLFDTFAERYDKNSFQFRK
jgi:predicted TPR repeat methyltransferase